MLGLMNWKRLGRRMLGERNMMANQLGDAHHVIAMVESELRIMRLNFENSYHRVESQLNDLRRRDAERELGFSRREAAGIHEQYP